MDTTVRAETKRCALLANKAATKARDGDWAAACRALEDIEHGPGNAASQASAPQVVEPDEFLGLPFREAKARILKMPADVAQQFAISLMIQNSGLKKYEPLLLSGASAPSVQVVEPRDEAAWLIELRPDAGITLWWDGTFQRGTGMFDKPTLTASMTNDANQAARFATRESAQKVLDGFLVMRPFCVFANAASLYSVTEHLWPAQASALPAAQQPAVEPAYLSDGKQAFPAATVARWSPHNRAHFTIPLYASPTAQPAPLTIHQQHWLDIREKVIDALAAKGHLMPLGNATAQPAATQPAPWPKALDKVQVFLPDSKTQAMCQPVFPCFDAMAMQEMEDRLLAQPAAPDVVADARRYRLLRDSWWFAISPVDLRQALTADQLDELIDTELDCTEGTKT